MTFLPQTKFFPQLKNHFLSFSQANMEFLGCDKIFCLDKYFVQVDGRGIRPLKSDLKIRYCLSLTALNQNILHGIKKYFECVNLNAKIY